MNKIYNTQKDFASGFTKFLKKVFPDIRKTQIKIIPYIIFGMITSESTVASDVANKLKDDFSLVQHDSVVKRIRRFFKNKLFDPYLFYDKIIKYVISNYKKKHDDKRVHIVFDHMYSHDNYTVFMITMRVGKQGIPLWFRCFKGTCDSDAFQEKLLKEGIKYVSNLFDNEYDLIFLADRWFNSTSLLSFIEELGHIYCIRLKRNMNVLVYDKKEGHEIWKSLDELQAYQKYATYYPNVYLTEKRYKTNITISKKQGVEEPWIVVTNGNPKRAIKDYGYRFGAIECFFKNQKSNGFYLESTVNSSLKYFESMYTMACTSVLYLTILGADYSKNTGCYKNVKITTHYTDSESNARVRILSLFNTGLRLFNHALNSWKYVRVPHDFILYDS